jgi:hypothetical protein
MGYIIQRICSIGTLGFRILYSRTLCGRELRLDWEAKHPKVAFLFSRVLFQTLLPASLFLSSAGQVLALFLGLHVHDFG